jgi:hypothetical protein
MRIFTLILFSSVICEIVIGQSKSKIDSDLSNQNVSPTSVNSFPIFLKNFKQDTVFQLSNIKFPLVKITSQDNDDFIQTIHNSTIETTQWRYLSLRSDSTYESRKINAYTERYFIKNDTAHLFYQGVDNGIDVEFLFTLINNKWFLIKWIDLSD